MKQEEEKVERERSRPPRPRLGQEKRWEILGGLYRAFSCQAFSRPALFRADCNLELGVPRCRARGSRGAVGEGLTEADTAGGQGLLRLRVPARDRRGREAVCPGVWVAVIGPG